MTTLDTTKIAKGTTLKIETVDFLNNPLVYSGPITSVSRRDDGAYLVWVRIGKRERDVMSVIIPESGITHKRISLH